MYLCRRMDRWPHLCPLTHYFNTLALSALRAAETTKSSELVTQRQSSRRPTSPEAATSEAVSLSYPSFSKPGGGRPWIKYRRKHPGPHSHMSVHQKLPHNTVSHTAPPPSPDESHDLCVISDTSLRYRPSVPNPSLDLNPYLYTLVPTLPAPSP